MGKRIDKNSKEFISKIAHGGDTLGKVLDAVDGMDLESILAVFCSAIYIIARAVGCSVSEVALAVLHNALLMDSIEDGE